MAALIGTRAHARYILDWYYIHRWNTSAVPDGWKHIGTGGSRMCYLHESSGVVYKVQTTCWDEEYSNEAEVRNAQRLLRKCRRNSPWRYVRIPKTSGFKFSDSFVVAMQFIEGSLGVSVQSISDAREELLSIGFGDMHGYNFVVDADGIHWPIDMGSPLPGSPGWQYADKRVLQGAV